MNNVVRNIQQKINEMQMICIIFSPRR